MDERATQVEALCACAWCRRVQHDGAWVVPGRRDAGRLKLHEHRAVLKFTHTICPFCLERVEEDCPKLRIAVTRRPAAS